MIQRSVIVVSDAEEDIFAIYKYIAVNDSIFNAIHVLEKIEETCLTLETNPERGHFLKELERLGIKEFREIHFKPYRVIYQIEKSNVYVHCVLDGRRELTDILQKRLLRS